MEIEISGGYTSSPLDYRYCDFDISDMISSSWSTLLNTRGINDGIERAQGRNGMSKVYIRMPDFVNTLPTLSTRESESERERETKASNSAYGWMWRAIALLAMLIILANYANRGWDPHNSVDPISSSRASILFLITVTQRRPCREDSNLLKQDMYRSANNLAQ